MRRLGKKYYCRETEPKKQFLKKQLTQHTYSSQSYKALVHMHNDKTLSADGFSAGG